MNKVKQIKAAANALHNLGLNQLEADVYVALLRAAEPQTAYRLGQTLGRPTANVYKAIAVLQEKGAVTVEEGQKRMCTAVPIDEFVGHVQREMSKLAQTARDAVAGLEVESNHARVFQIPTVSAVLERAARMLEVAEEVAVLDVFPGPLAELKDEVRAATDRGVKLFLQVYSPYRLKGAKVVQCSQADEVLDHWKSQQLNLVVDGRETLLALMNRSLSVVHQAIWSNSLYLSCMMHAGFMREHTFHTIVRQRDRHELPSWLNRIVDDELFFHTAKIPGQLDLFAETGVES